MNGIISGKSGISGGAKGLLIYETVTTHTPQTSGEIFTVPMYPIMITMRGTSDYNDSAPAYFAIRESRYNVTYASFWIGGFTTSKYKIVWGEDTVTIAYQGGGSELAVGSPVIILGY